MWTAYVISRFEFSLVLCAFRMRLVMKHYSRTWLVAHSTWSWLILQIYTGTIIKKDIFPPPNLSITVTEKIALSVCYQWISKLTSSYIKHEYTPTVSTVQILFYISFNDKRYFPVFSRCDILLTLWYWRNQRKIKSMGLIEKATNFDWINNRS